jgi:hypothetical protein
MLLRDFPRLESIWCALVGFIYFAIVVGILSTSKTQLETLALAILIQLYAAVIYNFSLIGAATDLNNYAALVRFRILANAQGLTAISACRGTNTITGLRFARTA